MNVLKTTSIPLVVCYICSGTLETIVEILAFQGSISNWAFVILPILSYIVNILGDSVTLISVTCEVFNSYCYLEFVIGQILEDLPNLFLEVLKFGIGVNSIFCCTSCLIIE